MPAFGKPLLDCLGNHRADAFDPGELFKGGSSDPVHRTEMPGQRASRGGADVPDRQRHDHPPQRLLLGHREVGDQLGAVRGQHPTVDDGVRRIGLLGRAGVQGHGDEPRHRVLGVTSRRVTVRSGCQVEQVTLVADDLGLEQGSGALPTEGLDVEGPFRTALAREGQFAVRTG